MKKNVIKLMLILLPAFALVLGALPNAAVMEFGTSAAEGGTLELYYSYFALEPAAFGNWGGILTMSMAAALLALYGILAVRDHLQLRLCAPLLGCVAVAASLLNVLFHSMTVIGWCISILLLLETVLGFIARKF